MTTTNQTDCRLPTADEIRTASADDLLRFNCEAQCARRSEVIRMCREEALRRLSAGEL